MSSASSSRQGRRSRRSVSMGFITLAPFLGIWASIAGFLGVVKRFAGGKGLFQLFLAVPDLVRHHHDGPADAHHVIAEEPPAHYRGVKFVVDKVVAEEGEKATLLGDR